MDPVIERWQQDGLVALAKPAGLPVFAPHADPDGDCLLKRWRAEQGASPVVDWPAGFDGGIAHRLDIPTSGQVLAARTVPDLVALRELFSSGALTKRYRFITARDVSWDAHIVQSRIAHDKRRKGRMIVERGRSTPHRGRWYEAHTELHRLGAVEGGWLWEAVIRTGVMHQIRVHAASVGLPLLGDRRYGGGAGLDGQPVDFFLHHIGLIGPGLTPPEDPLPDFWPLTR